MADPRKIAIPGVKIEAHTILVDASKNSVVAVPHAGEIVVVFCPRGDDLLPSARAMTYEQARSFADEVTRAHQAISDDARIAEMEREFNDGD